MKKDSSFTNDRKLSWNKKIKSFILESDTRVVVIGPVALGILLFVPLSLLVRPIFNEPARALSVVIFVFMMPLFILSGIVVLLRKEIPSLDSRKSTKGGWAVIQGIIWIVFWGIVEISLLFVFVKEILM